MSCVFPSPLAFSSYSWSPSPVCAPLALQGPQSCHSGALSGAGHVTVVPDSCRVCRFTRNNIDSLKREGVKSPSRHAEEHPSPNTDTASDEASRQQGFATSSFGLRGMTGQGTSNQRDSLAGGSETVSQRTCRVHSGWPEGACMEGAEIRTRQERDKHVGAELHHVAGEEGPGVVGGQDRHDCVCLYVTKTCQNQEPLFCAALGEGASKGARPLHLSQLRIEPVGPETILMDCMRSAAQQVLQDTVRFVPLPRVTGWASALLYLASWQVPALACPQTVLWTLAHVAGKVPTSGSLH